MASIERRGTGRHSEIVLLLVLVAATAFAVLLAVDKMAFLSFYQIPVLIAAYLLGRRQGIMVAIAAVLMVGIYAAINPAVFVPHPDRGPGVALFLWGAFTIVATHLVGALYEAKEAATHELSQAYEGLVDILGELVNAVDTRPNSRSVRVANLAARIGVALDLPVSDIEDLRVAGLLHDVHKVGVSLDVLRRASNAEVSGQAQDKGGIVKPASASGGLLRDVVPLLELYHEHYDGTGPKQLAGEQIPRGARVLRVADAFVHSVVPQPFGRGLSASEALMEIESVKGTLYDPGVVDALIAVSESTNLVA